jgi:7-cyano-7-deazaguanine synthase
MKALVLLSGGMDSATALALVLDQPVMGFKEVEVVSFNYGQRHAKELESAKAIAEHYKVNHTILDLRGAMEAFAGSALTGGGAVPEGHYEDQSMKKTVVPNRNMSMLSLAVGLAISKGFDQVIYGAHKGDHAIYPDCREEFYFALSRAVELCDYNPPKLRVPFITADKSSIALIGHQLKMPFELTWSCYKGGEDHCGVCGTCVERREAFKLAEIDDPTVYDGAEDDDDGTWDEQNQDYNREISASLKRHNSR